jgi:hypothetical protein
VFIYGTQDSVFGVVTCCRLGGPGFEFHQGQEVFCPPKLSRATLASCSMGNGVLSAGCEIGLSPPSSAEFKNGWNYTYFPPLYLCGMYRDDFIFYLSVCFFRLCGHDLHPAVMKLGMQYADRVVVGSNARCIALLNVLKQVRGEVLRCIWLLLWLLLRPSIRMMI